MNDKFQLVMNAVDDDLLEEAFAPVKRKNLLPWIRVAIAACLMLVLGLTFAHSRNSAVTFTDLSDKHTGVCLRHIKWCRSGQSPAWQGCSA